LISGSCSESSNCPSDVHWCLFAVTNVSSEEEEASSDTHTHTHTHTHYGMEEDTECVCVCVEDVRLTDVRLKLIG